MASPTTTMTIAAGTRDIVDMPTRDDSIVGDVSELAASATLEKSGNVVGDSATALLTKGAVLEAQKKWAEAGVALRGALAKDPTLTTAWFSLGCCLTKGHAADYDGAEAAYLRAIALDPTHAAAYNHLGNLLSDVRKDHDSAEAAYRKAIAIDPKHAAAYRSLGTLLVNVRKDYSGAEAAYRTAITLDPKHATVHMNLSYVLQNQGSLTGAIDATHDYIRAGNPHNDGEQRLVRLQAQLRMPARLPDASLAIHSGWLLKKGEGFMAQSRYRWFVLYRTGDVYYFKTPNQDLVHCKGVISLSGVKSSDVARSGTTSTSGYHLAISTPRRKWVLTAASITQLEGWRGALSGLLDSRVER